MNGCTFKATAITFALLATTFLPALTFAIGTANDPAKTSSTNDQKLFSAKLGCMSCHQGTSLQTDQAAKKSNDNLPQQNQSQTVPAK